MFSIPDKKLIENHEKLGRPGFSKNLVLDTTQALTKDGGIFKEITMNRKDKDNYVYETVQEHDYRNLQ